MRGSRIGLQEVRLSLSCIDVPPTDRCLGFTGIFKDGKKNKKKPSRLFVPLSQAAPPSPSTSIIAFHASGSPPH